MEPGKDANRRWKQVSGYVFAVLAFVCGWWGGLSWSRRAEDSKATHGISPVGPEAQVEVPATIHPKDRAPLASTVDHDSRPTESALVETPLPLESAIDTDWLARALDLVGDPQLNPEGQTLTHDELLWLAETLQLVNDPPDDLENCTRKPSRTSPGACTSRVAPYRCRREFARHPMPEWGSLSLSKESRSRSTPISIP